MRPRLCLFLILLLLPATASGVLPAKWRELEPMFGGPVNRISVDTAGTVYLSTPGGVFKSADAGASWASVRGDLPGVPTGGAILADPVTAGTVYLWMTEGFFRTLDGGATWTRLPLELPTGVYVQEIAVAPSDPGHLFAATWGDYVYRSLDGGATWERRSTGLSGGWSGPSYVTAIAVDPVNADRVYTSTWRGLLFRSDDGATTWSQMSDSGTWANSQMHVARSSPNVLYTLHDEYWFGRGTVLRSGDHGDTWTAMARPHGAGDAWQLAVDPTDADVLYAANAAGISKSVDGGASWSTALAPTGRPAMGSVAIDPSNVPRVYGGHDSTGLYRSLDAGASWEQSNSGLTAVQFTALEIVLGAPATVWAGVQGTGFLKSTDGGASWTAVGTAEGLGSQWLGAIAGHPYDPAVAAATTSDDAGGHLWKSADGGATFTQTATGYAPRWIRFHPHTPSVVNASVSDWQGGFLRSTDTAASWSIPYSWYIYPLNYDYHPTLANVVFSVADQYTGAALTTLHVVWSNDGGATWTGNALTTSLTGSDLALDQNDPATLYMASELSGEGTRGVYKFSVAYSGGNVASVTRVPGTFNSGLTDTKVLRLVYDKVHSALYAATPSGIFRSLDQAATWAPIPGLPHPPTPWMAVTPDGSRLLVATSGGIWELGPNAAPTADDQPVSTAEDAEVDVTLTGSDPDGGTLAFSIVSGPDHGALSGTPPALTYTPDPNYFGPDGFTFEADDGLASDQGEVSLTVTPVNDLPWFDPIADGSVPFNAGPQEIEVTGLSAGPPNESDQTVTLSAVSDNPEVAADPTITWSGPVLLDEVFLGGEGDQRGRGIAAAGGAVWLSVDTAEKVDALIARYDLPLEATPAWTRLWPDQPGDTAWDELPGIGAADDGVYAAGRSWSQTTDGVGDKEAKSVVVKLNPDGSAGGEATGAVWVSKPHYHPYTGHEGFNAGMVAVEGGQPHLYAAGGAQVNFCNHRPMAMKVDASGVEVWRYADTAGTCGDAMALALIVDGGSVYLAGRVFEGGTPYPYLAKLDAATGALAWARQGSADFPSSGAFLAVAVSSGTVYAAGWQAGAGGEDYLLDTWDTDGTRVPLSGSLPGGARADRIQGLAALGPELWAVGSTRSQDDPDGNGGAGFSDGVLFEVDPATGAALSTTVYGAESGRDEAFQTIAAAGIDLYVAGESRSSTAGGNALGSNDAVLLRYARSTATLNYTPLAPGTVTFTVTADDGQAENHLLSRTFTVTVTNAPPVAVDDSVSTPELTPVTVGVLANDVDPEGDLLVVTGHTAAAHGTTGCGATSCTYAPDLGFQGADSFTYTVEDGFGAMDTATVSVMVTPSPGLDFHTVAPCRVVDTRSGSPLLSGSGRTLTLTGVCGVPATAKAVSINLTVLSPTGNGRIVLYPGGTPVPTTSVLNFAAGVNRANNAVVVLAPSGAGTIEALAVFGVGTGQVHATIDVNGYYE
jgi:Bacterial Ig domain